MVIIGLRTQCLVSGILYGLRRIALVHLTKVQVSTVLICGLKSVVRWVLQTIGQFHDEIIALTKEEDADVTEEQDDTWH